MIHVVVGWLAAAGGAGLCLVFLGLAAPGIYDFLAGKPGALDGVEAAAVAVFSGLFAAVGVEIARRGVRIARSGGPEARQSARAILIGALLIVGVPLLAYRFDLKLATAQWLAAGVFAGFWLVFAAANAFWGWLSWVKKVESPPSLVPLVASFFGLLAVARAPIASAGLKCTLGVLAVLLDVATMSLLVDLGAAAAAAAARKLRRAL